MATNVCQFDTLKEVLNNSLNDIEYLFQYQTIRYSKWMSLYTHIYNFCTKNEQCHHADLYENLRIYLKNYLENFCQSIKNIEDKDILEFYINEWNKYRISSKILHGICSYLNRHYIKRECEYGNSDICEIYTLAMKIWQEVVSHMFNNQITKICLNMIESERNQQIINTEIIRNIIQIYVTFDFNKNIFNLDNNIQILDYYQEYFEKQFLIDTQEFYRLKSITYLQQHSVMDYLSKIPQYIDEEIHRIVTYLHPSTIKNLNKKLEEVLIHDQLTIFYSQAKIFLYDERIEELNLLYQTIIRIENSKIPLINIFENYIHQIGIQIIESINPISFQNLKIYIETIYNFHQKYLIFIQKSFNNDQEFIDAFDRTCRKFINNNIIIQTIGNTTIMAEYLARYCDVLLRKKKTDEINLDIIFNQLKILLKYIQDKDVFEKLYSKFLVKRLINQWSISNDYERTMISYIQNTCDFSYVFKMKQMCNDIEISKTIFDRYNQKNQQLINKIDFNIIILNSNTWLFSIPLDIILPNSIQLILNDFNQFYNQLFEGRKLIWLYQHSKNELKTFFTDKTYALQVSMYQMVILLLFNDSIELTIEEIHDKTHINIDLLIQILNTLLESKILICKEFINQLNLDMDCKIKLSNNFTSDKHRINLNIPMKSIEQNDTEIFHKNIDQDRIMTIQATIVRIMKLHKTMNQNLLIQTIIQQLNSHFNPNISTIKDCINILIKKEYLERQSNNPDVLCYMT